MTRIPYDKALRRTALLDALAEFDPHVAGTLPLGIDVPDSDVDISVRSMTQPLSSRS